MAELKKILIVLVVAVLFSIFVFTLIEAVYPSPDYNDFCSENSLTFPEGPPRVKDCPPLTIPEGFSQECFAKEGRIDYTYDANGCPVSYECNTCSAEYNNAREKHAFVVFVISSILGLIAVLGGVSLPSEKNPLNEWVGTGFMFGGLISLFIGTAIYFSDLHRFWRPVVILIELLLVLWLAYKKLSPAPARRKKRK